jgi:D-alanyl-D-alanine carboxypeptidase
MQNSQIEKKNEKVFIAAGIISLVLIVMVMLFVFSQNQYSKIDELSHPIGQIEKTEKETLRPDESGKISSSNFENLKLSAQSAVVYDVKHQRFLYQKREKDVLPLASLTKLMTALTAVELLPKESTIRIAQEYLQEENGGGLLANERWNADDLISLTLVASSNVGSRAIATVAGAFLPAQPSNPRQSFVEHLNDRATELGLDSMHFYNDSGLDIDLTQSGAYGSAADIAKLTSYILKHHPELLESTTHSKLSFVSDTKFVHNIKNTNTIVDTIPGVIASKTGYTDLAQGNLAVAFAPGIEGPYIAVVLGSTYSGRFSDIEKLVAATVSAATTTQPAKTN